MIFWTKLFFVILWTIFVSIVGTFRALFHWGNKKNFSPAVHLLADGVLKITGIKFQCEGMEHLGVHEPTVYLGNHQSFFDVIAFGYIVPPNTVPIGKKEIGSMPFVGWFFRGNGAILIDRKNRKSAFSELDKAVEVMKNEKISIGVLPEGTRNLFAGGLLPFKKGAFHMAIRAQAPIVPIVVSQFKHLISWETKTFKSGTILLKVLPPISTVGLTLNEVDSLMENVRNQMVSTFQELNRRAGIDWEEKSP